MKFVSLYGRYKKFHIDNVDYSRTKQLTVLIISPLIVDVVCPPNVDGAL